MTSLSPPVLPDAGPAGSGDQAGDPEPPKVGVGLGPSDTLSKWRSPDPPQADQEEAEGWLFPSPISDAPSPPPTPVRGRKPRGRAGRGGSPGRPVRRSSRRAPRPDTPIKSEPGRVDDTSELLSAFAMIISGLTAMLPVVSGDGVGDGHDPGQPLQRADTPFSPNLAPSP